VEYVFAMSAPFDVCVLSPLISFGSEDATKGGHEPAHKEQIDVNMMTL
jgi:hypothetical protein